MKNIAIVAVAFNRVDSLSRLLDSLSNAYYSNDNIPLIISIDKSKTDKVEKYAENFEWKHGPKIVDTHLVNLGLRNHMMSLGKWFDYYDAIIVLEDDIFVSPSFFYYAQQTVDYYYSNKQIAGISLYSLSFNTQNNLPFTPLNNGYDGYFINSAISWGEIWMKDQWYDFYNWYQEHKLFPLESRKLPNNLFGWGDSSWLKYHIWYCVENDKYFFFPYNSLSTNCADKGTNNRNGGQTTTQSPLIYGKVNNFRLPDFRDDSLRYSSFYENEYIYRYLGLSKEELCIDLGGTNNNKDNKRYYLTVSDCPFRIIRSFALKLRPIELNILYNLKGEEIHLYDTFYKEKYANKKTNNLVVYSYKMKNMQEVVSLYGYKRLFVDLFFTLIKKIKTK